MTNARETLPPERRSGSDDLNSGERVGIARDSSNQPVPMRDDDPDVGLSQKGTDEDAIVRRETEI